MKIFELTSTGDPYTFTEGDKYYRAVYDEHKINVEIGDIFCLEERDEDWLKCHKNLMIENDKVVRWRPKSTGDLHKTSWGENIAEGEEYFYIDSTHEISGDTAYFHGDKLCKVDQMYYDGHNMFATKELAESAAEQIKKLLKNLRV